MIELILLVLLGLGVAYWIDGLRAREQAWIASAQACRRLNVQLLDDTVVLERLWLRCSDQQGWYLERHYLFEFTDNGADRRLGKLVMVGQRVEVLYWEGGDLLVP